VKRKPPGAHKINSAGENGNAAGHHSGFGPKSACGELPKSSGE
jgi:hypothetical protein